MNLQAIWETVEYMEKEPRRIDMIDGIVTASEATQFDEEHPYPHVKRLLLLPPCNTAACFAGAAVLSHRDVKQSDLDFWHSWARVKEEAIEILDLTHEEAARLFYLPSIHGDGEDPSWPKENEAEYFAAKTPEERAIAVRRRVQRFIDTNGTE